MKLTTAAAAGFAMSLSACAANTHEAHISGSPSSVVNDGVEGMPEGRSCQDGSPARLGFSEGKLYRACEVRNGCANTLSPSPVPSFGGKPVSTGNGLYTWSGCPIAEK